MADTCNRQRLVAILAADVVGYSRLMAADELGTVAALDAARSVFRSRIESHQGRVIDMAGDSVLAVFETAHGAVSAALAIQEGLKATGTAVPEDQRMHYRIGVHLGDVIEKPDGTVYGDGVNIAARLEGLAEPGGIAVSDAVQGTVRNRLAATFEDQGEHRVKNIAQPVRVYSLDMARQGTAATDGRAGARRRRFVPIAAISAIIAVAAGIALLDASDFPEIARIGLPVWLGGKPGEAVSSKASIAVLPFANHSGDAKRDYFSEGITEDIINALGRFSGVMVIAHNTAQSFKGRNVPQREISRELGVRYIVQGSVREADGMLRVAVELSDADKGTLLWSERYQGAGGEVFAIQDRVVKDIVGALAVKLTRLEQQRISAKPSERLEAYDLVLQARELLNQAERSANRRARELLERATRLAPNYAEAYLAMSEASYQRAGQGWMEDIEEGVRESEALAKRVLLLDDSGAHARAHALLGRANAFFLRYEEALTEADLAIALNASDAVAYAMRGAVLLWLGRVDESIASSETARRFDPHISAESGFNLSLAYYTAGRYREAVAIADSFLARYPRFVFSHAVRAAALAQLGKDGEAHQAAETVMRLSPFFRKELFGTRFMKRELTAKAQEGLAKAGL